MSAPDLFSLRVFEKPGDSGKVLILACALSRRLSDVAIPLREASYVTEHYDSAYHLSTTTYAKRLPSCDDGQTVMWFAINVASSKSLRRAPVYCLQDLARATYARDIGSWLVSSLDYSKTPTRNINRVTACRRAHP